MSSGGMDGSNRAQAFERELIQAADADIPPPEGKDRLRAALAAKGVCVALGTVASTAGAAGGSSARIDGVGDVAEAGAAAPAASGIVSGMALAKWVVAGVFAGSLAVGTATIIHPTHAPSSLSIQPSPGGSPSSESIPGIATTTYVENRQAPFPQPDQLPSSMVPQPANRVGSHTRWMVGGQAPSGAESTTRDTTASPRASASAPAAVEPSARTDPRKLAAQVALLDSARRALNANNVAEASRLVERYRAEFPRGELAPEAEQLNQSIQEAGGRQGGRY